MRKAMSRTQKVAGVVMSLGMFFLTHHLVGMYGDKVLYMINSNPAPMQEILWSIMMKVLVITPGISAFMYLEEDTAK